LPTVGAPIDEDRSIAHVHDRIKKFTYCSEIELSGGSKITMAIAGRQPENAESEPAEGSKKLTSGASRV